jgi:hypothetical protein
LRDEVENRQRANSEPPDTQLRNAENRQQWHAAPFREPAARQTAETQARHERAYYHRDGFDV